MSENNNSNPFKRLIKATTLVEPHELRATILSFLFVFTLFTAYFIVRPARDAMASDWSRAVHTRSSVPGGATLANASQNRPTVDADSPGAGSSTGRVRVPGGRAERRIRDRCRSPAAHLAAYR